MSTSVVSRLKKSIELGRKGRNKGLSSGFDRLDSITYGIQRKYFSVICGDSGSGKSTYALYTHVYRPLMEYLENNKDINILYFSFEMSDEVLFTKLLSIYIWEKFNQIITYEEILSLKKSLTDEQFKYIEKGYEWLEKIENRIKIIDKSVPASGVYAIVKEWNKKFGEFVELSNHSEIFIPKNPEAWKIIVIDHIRLLGTKGGSIKEQIDLCCNYLLGFRNKCDNTICVVQQLNRGFKSMDRRNSGTYQLLQLDDLADSSSPAQSAEIVLGIFDAYRERMNTCEGYQVSQMLDSFRLIQVMKNRFGLSNKNIGVAFAGEIGYWRELPKPNEIYDYSIYSNLLPYKHNIGENNKPDIKQQNTARFVF